jgi:hypothetical protein
MDNVKIGSGPVVGNPEKLSKNNLAINKEI